LNLMALFSFFKKKKEVEIDFLNEKDQRKIISSGILFEDAGKLLKWGSPVKELALSVGVKEKIFADRTVYNWGEHTILNGLKLAVTTTFWNHKEESRDKRFNTIEFSVVGNEEADRFLKLITAHIEGQLGPPGNKDITETEVTLKWMINGVELKLHFLEKHASKLHFEISKV
jgi:hypothetical protein